MLNMNLLHTDCNSCGRYIIPKYTYALTKAHVCEYPTSRNLTESYQMFTAVQFYGDKEFKGLWQNDI